MDTGASIDQARMPRMAVRRWAAWRHTTLRGPANADAEISSPRWAGRQCITTAPGAPKATNASSMMKPEKASSRAARYSSWPMLVHTSV